MEKQLHKTSNLSNSKPNLINLQWLLRKILKGAALSGKILDSKQYEEKSDFEVAFFGKLRQIWQIPLYRTACEKKVIPSTFNTDSHHR